MTASCRSSQIPFRLLRVAIVVFIDVSCNTHNVIHSRIEGSLITLLCDVASFRTAVWSSSGCCGGGTQAAAQQPHCFFRKSHAQKACSHALHKIPFLPRADLLDQKQGAMHRASFVTSQAGCFVAFALARISFALTKPAAPTSKGCPTALTRRLRP